MGALVVPVGGVLMLYVQASLTFDSRFREGRARKDPSRVLMEVDLAQLLWHLGNHVQVTKRNNQGKAKGKKENYSIDYPSWVACNM